MKKLLLLLFFFASITFVQAQGFAVTGTVHSAQNKETLPGASVLLLRVSDSVKTATVTDKDGNFRFATVKPGQYAIQLNYIGHKPFSRAVTVQNGPVNLGQLMLEEASTTMKEIEIVGQIPLGTQKGDTTVFNAAAFKVADDASAEDLVTKLPGVTIVDGKVQAQGEEVRQVLVDGKRFFGEDANTALRNLPAEVIENIEIFDKKSDQAEFSGFDDGNRAKTINIVTKKNRRKGQFGKVSVGAGPDENKIIGSDTKYMAGASVNIFNGDRRFTFTGITNNINMQDFSVGEAPGGGMRGRRGSGGGNSGGGNGIATTNNFGLNYSDMWSQKIEASGNYNYSNTKNENESDRYTELFRSNYYRERSTGQSININRNESHNVNLRIDYKINDRNRLLINPRISLQNNKSNSESSGFAVFDSNRETEEYEETDLNASEGNSNTTGLSYSLNNNINYSHRFNKPGRTVSVGLNTSYSINDGSTIRYSKNTDYIENKVRVLDQKTETGRTGMSWRSNVSLSEKVGEKARVQAEYSISNRYEDSDRLVYDWQESDYTLFNGKFSNSFVSEYMTQQAKTSYLYNTDKVRFQLETQVQMADLQNEREYPTLYQTDRTFYNVLPFAQLEYKFSKTKNIQFDYRTSTEAPSVSQLQDVVDITNLQRLRVGNSELVQAYQNSLNLRYRSFNTENNRVVTFFVTASQTDDYITNSTINKLAVLKVDPMLTHVRDTLQNGAQLSRPVNLDGNWSARSFFSYGQPIKAIKSNVNFTGNTGYNRIPGMFNEEEFFSYSKNYGMGVSLSSNISQNIDFNFSTNRNYYFVTSTLATGRNDKYYNQSTQLRANLRFWKGLVYRTELSHQLYRNLSDNANSNFNTHYTLLNMSLSKKVLKGQKGEVSLSVNDLLRQNVAISRSVNDASLVDSRSAVLQRFFMLTFSYNIRNFAGGAPGGRGQSGERAPGERGNFRQGGQGGGQGGFERQGGQGGGGWNRD